MSIENEIAAMNVEPIEVETYNDITPHLSRVAAWAESDSEDRRFWAQGRGGASPALALTPERFVERFFVWALDEWDSVCASLALVNLNIKRLVAAGKTETAQFLKLGQDQESLEWLRDVLESLSLEEDECDMDAINWRDENIHQAATLFADSLRKSRIWRFSDKEIAAALDALRAKDVPA